MQSGNTSHVPKDRSTFLRVFMKLCRHISERQNMSVLVIGGNADDVETLWKLGFRRITLSNLPNEVGPGTQSLGIKGITTIPIDAEEMAVPDNSYDITFAHEVLHHCRSPHRALCEMLRVSKQYVLFMEPNDSFAMRCLVRMRFSFPYELGAVTAHDCKRGGLRDSVVPNYIYRWDKDEVRKTASSFLAEQVFSVYSCSYWDFNVSATGLARRRKYTNLGILLNFINPNYLLGFLRVGQAFVNRVPVLRGQGNKFLCLVEKHAALKPWLTRDKDEIVFKMPAPDLRIPVSMSVTYNRFCTNG